LKNFEKKKKTTIKIMIMESNRKKIMEGKIEKKSNKKIILNSITNNQKNKN
jgi:hypothetical protein